MILTCQAILFDLDGVLVDSTRTVERVWRNWACKHGLNPEVVLENAHGRRSIETIRIVAPHLDAEQENLRVESMEISDTDGIVPIPGARELLYGLPPDRFTVVTSATAALAATRLRHAGLFTPSRMVTADDVAEGKPSPKPYLKGAAALGFVPIDCLVFEDTPAGIESGKAAGMRVIGLRTTYPSSQLTRADAILDSLVAVSSRLLDGVLQIELLP